jgi:predicted Zn-dependent protease
MMDEELRAKLDRAIQLRQAGDAEAARALLVPLAQSYPDDSGVQYQTAWTHDNLGLEREAIPYYLRALAVGLSGEDRQGALLGLGSTYRTLGEYEQSEAILRQGVTKFPDNRAIQVFLAMTLYNRGKHVEAMEILLRHLAETSDDPDIRRYQRAILLYAPDLDKIWDESA